MKKEYLKIEEPFNQENEVQKSVEDFLMKVILPRLEEDTRKNIVLMVKNGVSITGAFELSGVNTNTCIR